MNVSIENECASLYSTVAVKLDMLLMLIILVLFLIDFYF